MLLLFYKHDSYVMYTCNGGNSDDPLRVCAACKCGGRRSLNSCCEYLTRTIAFLESYTDLCMNIDIVHINLIYTKTILGGCVDYRMEICE